MKFKDFSVKATDEGNGGFTGYAATFDREPDSYGDVIARGAFTDTLKAWTESGRPVPVLYGHNMDDPDFNIGTAELMEDERGLKVSVVLPPPTATPRQPAPSPARSPNISWIDSAPKHNQRGERPRAPET